LPVSQKYSILKSHATIKAISAASWLVKIAHFGGKSIRNPNPHSPPIQALRNSSGHGFGLVLPAAAAQ
jgi:hypothetical protein